MIIIIALHVPWTGMSAKFSDSGCEVCTSAGASLRFEVVSMGSCRIIVMVPGYDH